MPNITVSASGHYLHKDITVISAKGFIDTTTAPEFEKVFQMVLGENKYNLIVDLKDVSYISSAGWGIFIGELKRIRGQKGNLFLTGMGPEVTEVFELLEFNTILKSFSDVDQAVTKGYGKSLAGKAPDKTKTAKDPNSPAAGTALPEPTPAENAGAPLTFQTPKKIGFFERLLKPWKWF
jgi:anti-anti-sigma factor